MVLFAVQLPGLHPADHRADHLAAPDAVFLDTPASESPLLRGIAVKLDEALSGGRYYTPLPVALEPVDCPGCQGPFEVDGVGTLDQLVCPDCGRREAIVVGPESDWQMSGDLHESS